MHIAYILDIKNVQEDQAVLKVVVRDGREGRGVEWGD